MKTFLLIFLSIFAANLVFLASESNAQSGDPEEIIHEMIDKVSIDNLSDHILELEYAGGTNNRIAFTPGVDSASVYVKEQFSKIPGLTSVEFDTFYVDTAVSPYDEQPQVNVVATIEGESEPDKSYVLGGHIDATADRDGAWESGGANWEDIDAPGADDNATGVAAILEIARILADPETDFSSDYTIELVAFGAEERLPGVVYSGGGSQNHHGSRHFAFEANQSGKDILGMTSIDMIGYNNNYEYTDIVKVDNHVAEESRALGEKYLDVNEQFSIGLIMDDPPFASGGYSDHNSFAIFGYPAILMIENGPPWSSDTYYQFNPYYHTQDDTYDKLNMELVKMVTQLNLATVAALGSTVTSTEKQVIDEVPGKFQLSQNYPNPFNPETTINYTLFESGHVSLKVYDSIGRKVTTLVNKTMSPGEHSVTFNSNNSNRELSSGVYIYKLEVGEHQKSKNMLLVK